MQTSLRTRRPPWATDIEFQHFSAWMKLRLIRQVDAHGGVSMEDKQISKTRSSIILTKTRVLSSPTAPHAWYRPTNPNTKLISFHTCGVCVHFRRSALKSVSAWLVTSSHITSTISGSFYKEKDMISAGETSTHNWLCKDEGNGGYFQTTTAKDRGNGNFNRQCEMIKPRNPSSHGWHFSFPESYRKIAESMVSIDIQNSWDTLW